MHQAPPNYPQSRWSSSTFSVSGEGDEEEQASGLWPKVHSDSGPSFEDTPHGTGERAFVFVIVIGEQVASSLLFSLYSKHRRDYIHAIQMRRNAWRQVQAGTYTPCLKIWSPDLRRGCCTNILKCDQWEAAPVFLIYIFEHLIRYLEVRLWSSQKQEPLEGQTGLRVSWMIRSSESASQCLTGWRKS